MSIEEANKVLEELYEVRPELLNDKAKRLFYAIMTIANDRDKGNNIIDKLINEVTIKDSEISDLKDRNNRAIDYLDENSAEDTTGVTLNLYDDDYWELYKILKGE